MAGYGSYQGLVSVATRGVNSAHGGHPTAPDRTVHIATSRMATLLGDSPWRCAGSPDCFLRQLRPAICELSRAGHGPHVPSVGDLEGDPRALRIAAATVPECRPDAQVSSRVRRDSAESSGTIATGRRAWASIGTVTYPCPSRSVAPSTCGVPAGGSGAARMSNSSVDRLTEQASRPVSCGGYAWDITQMAGRDDSSASGSLTILDEESLP